MNDMGIIERSLRESVYCETGDYPNMWVSTADCATTLIKKLFEKYVEDDETRESMDFSVMGCGHIILYSAYIDSDKCVLCDKAMIEQIS